MRNDTPTNAMLIKYIRLQALSGCGQGIRGGEGRWLASDLVEAVGGRDGGDGHHVGGHLGQELGGDALAWHHVAHLGGNRQHGGMKDLIWWGEKLEV